MDDDPPFVGKDDADIVDSPLRIDSAPMKRSIIVRADKTDRARVIGGGRRFAYGRGRGPGYGAPEPD
jgi:hypothetical protein